MCHFLATGTDNVDNICRKILQQELDLTLALCHHEKQRNEVKFCCSIQKYICVSKHAFQGVFRLVFSLNCLFMVLDCRYKFSVPCI